jgi:hypothetical protein
LATTRNSPHGREQARATSGGVAAEHATKIYAVAIPVIVVIVAFLALTSTGHVIDAATQRFMLFYAGVFALIALCASTVFGLIATDRVFLNPGHRVFAQSAHRAASFGAVTFLIIHIVTEILAQRVHLLDAVIPFLSPFRTFYIGLGTIASDLILLVVITSIMRGRFNAHGKAWRWRAIHYTSYASFVFGIWHGLLAGRPGSSAVDWSYGLLVAFVLLGLAVRIFAHSLRPKESLSEPPVAMSANSASATMRAAAMFAQLGLARAANTGGHDRLMVASTAEPMLSAPVGGGYPSGPMLAAPMPAGTGQMYYEPGYEGPARYLGAPRDPGSGPLPQAGTGPMPRPGTGPMPHFDSGPMPRAGSGPMPHFDSGPMPRAGSGPMPRAATGPISRPGTGPIPRMGTGPIPAGTGPMPRAWTGPMPVPGSDHRSEAGTGSWAQSGDRSGPMPRAASGPMPRGATGPPPRTSTGPYPRPGTGSMPRTGSGPMPQAATGPQPWPGSGPWPRAATSPQPWPASGFASGPMPRAATGPQPRPASGPMPRAATGPQPRPASGPRPRAATGSFPGSGSGPMPRPATGPMRAAQRPDQRGSSGPRPGTGPIQRPQTGPLPRPGSGPWPQQPGGAGPWSGYGSQDGHGAQPGYRAQGGFPGPQPGPGAQGKRGGQPGQRGGPRPGGGGAGGNGGGGANRAQAPWDGGLPEPDPAFKYREPGPGMPGYRVSRDHPYGGDTR